MGKTNFQYDETGNTYNYVFLTFIGVILFPSTYYFWLAKASNNVDDEQRRQRLDKIKCRTGTYWQACVDKEARLSKKSPWVFVRKCVISVAIFVGWILFAMIVYQISQFDYEMANFDPYEILEVSLDSSMKEIKRKYRELSLKYHPDKPTGNEKLFMKLTKAYDALTDDTARYNWEHYGNPDGPQAMQFGIGLPAWIVEEKNSIWVLSLYTFVFMICLPTAVYFWWANSSKFSGEQVLLDTTQLYYYFFHKTPHMMLKRVLMVLAASLEFEKGHNSEIVERPTDNIEIPWVIKNLTNLGVNNKEKPLCFVYSIKARVIIFAHLSRVSLPVKTLHVDRLYIVRKCPALINEMVSCIAQLILLAHAGRISRIPSLDTIEAAMRCSPMIVQAMWEKSSPILQLPHLHEDVLKHLQIRKRNVKTLAQFTAMDDGERRSVLRTLTDDQYDDVLSALSMLPSLRLEVTTEVVEDDEQHIVTAGSIVTVTAVLHRKPLFVLNPPADGSADDDSSDESDTSDIDDKAQETQELIKSKQESKPVWKKPEKKAKNKSGLGKKKVNKPQGKCKQHSIQQQQQQQQPTTTTTTTTPEVENEVDQDESAGSEAEGRPSCESGGEDRTNNSGQDGGNAIDDDDEEEWARFQKRIKKRERVLVDGPKRKSHPVHCPYFSDDKQEYWWVYVADRKGHALITPPQLITGLVEREEVELKFTAPSSPGHYTFCVCVRSDSYLGVDVMEEIRLDVCKAAKVVKEHPQWQFEDSEDDSDLSDSDSDDEGGKKVRGKGKKKDDSAIDDQFATDDSDSDDGDELTDSDHSSAEDDGEEQDGSESS